MVKTKGVVKITRTEAIRELWYRGELSWLLRKDQRIIYDLIRRADGLKFCLYCSRRWGKSFTCILMAFEDAIRGGGWLLGFVAPTQLSLKRVYEPIVHQILKTCPSELKPKWNRDLGAYVFGNRSMLFMSGTDNKRYEGLRGMNLHRCYFDEPGSMSDLSVIDSSIITPQTLTTKNDRQGVGVIFLGTPSATPAHDYFFIKERCKSDGNFVIKTIRDNPTLDDATIEEYIEEAGGIESTACRREYFCEDVVDSENAVLPEFTDAKRDTLVQDFERPDSFQLYGALDPAFNDYTGYLLGYYDFKEGVYKVEAEAWFNKSGTKDIAASIKMLESRYFPNNRVYCRVSDVEPILIYDLASEHQLEFVQTRKDNKQAQVNKVRTLISDDRLLIHPRCKNLIRQMRTAIWNVTRTKYERIESEGHFDLIDALVYLVRNVDEFENPYQASHHYANETTIAEVFYGN